MDSINFSETQSAPLNWRNTASNTNPIACACCGSKDYTQTKSQANYFRILYPGTPRCKHSQDDCEGSCRSPPFFPTSPLLQPFFHNNTMPGYVCCSHYHLDDAAIAMNQVLEQSQTENKNNKKVSLSEDSTFDQKVKRESDRDSTSLNENAKKNIGPLGTDPQVSAHPFFFTNSMDPRFNAFQQCPCGDSMPWTCSPFIIPIISYCLFWNSQKHNKIFLSNYPGIQSETKFQQHNEEPPRHSSPNEEKTDNLKIMHQQIFDYSVANKNELEDDLGIDISSKKETIDSTETFQNFADCESCSGTEKKKSVEKETMASDNSITENQTDNDEFLYMDIQSPFHSKMQLLMDPDNDCSKENSSRMLLESQSQTNDLFENCEEEPIVSKVDEEDCLSLRKSSMDVPEQSSHKFAEEVLVANAAAGDVGGEHCLGYKIHIQPFEEPHELDNRKKNESETNLRNNESKLLKALVELKEKKPESCLEKNAETNRKNYRLKTGMAKNSNRINPQESKDNKESSQEEVCVIRRKHACFPSKDQIENSSNFQKFKSQTTIKHQDLGSGKLQKALNTKTQPFKRDEKVSTLKVLPHTTQTQSNSTLKNRKK